MGVEFPLVNGKPSSSAVSRGMMEAALAGVAPAAKVSAGITNWRKEYGALALELTRWDDPSKGPDVARRGLAFLGALRSGEGTLADIVPAATPATQTYVGTGRVGELSIPFDGEELSPGAFVRSLPDWRHANAITTSAADRLTWAAFDGLDLSGRKIAVIGAGAELAPTRFLLSRGADVFAVIRPQSPRLAGLIAETSELPGTLHVPAVGDVATEPEVIAGWLIENDVEAILECLYAPGAKFLAAAIGADQVIRMVTEARDVLVSYLGSPLDAFVLPSHLQPGGAEWSGRPRGNGAMAGGVFDAVIPLQGPNYLAAKRIGRWRATDLRARGKRVSYHVAPLAQTHSVLDTPILKAAYRGIGAFGITSFPADGTASIMAMLFAADLLNPRTLGNDFLVDSAFPSGVWASNRTPALALKRAAILGKLMVWKKIEPVG
ncbi:hypothetical protein J2S49_000448 [Arcanobacterium wilhelmae]|uniref:Uncharacterized protein n=1 Tax=Arcanobacterium wilhelmae TaxID=1803177 RepID=A0ABT9N9K2_9ACTO|nr:hypothetical protein [Arcanobacterium wilhelmae]MDP9800372.1 hypothetical protein [Arcanobacterium wilhelmae]WFN89803.1 hypothetical protein P8A24_06245 [Arcanobacterium wilhelmae]